MAATGSTPISLYYSTTASAVPTSGNLANGELGLNIADMKLYAKNSAGTVTLLASSGGATGTVSSVSGTGTVNGLTLTGTVTTSGSLTLGGTLSLVSPPAIGSTTPNTGAFTTLSATKGSAGQVAFFLSGNAAQSPYISFGRAAEDVRIQIAAATNDLFTGTVAGDYATNSNASIWFGTGGIGKIKISSTGLDVYGSINLPTINSYIRGGGHDVIQVDATRTYFYGGTSGVQFRTSNNASQLVEITDVGAIGVGTSGSFGTAGQVLTSAGSGAAPTWTTPAGGGSQAFVAFGSTGGL